MTTTIHNIYMGVGNNNIKSIIDNVMGNLINNIENNNGEFIETITLETKRMMQYNVAKFAFKGNLMRGIGSRVFKKTKRGEVYIKDDQALIAAINEFGVKPHLVPNVGEMREWVNQKAPKFANARSIPVGYRGGGSHVIIPNPINKFWQPTAEMINQKIPDIFGLYLERIIENS